MSGRIPTRAAGAYRMVRDGVAATLGVGPHFSAQPLGKHIDPAGLGGYYCDMSHKARAASQASDGFPRFGRGPAVDAFVIPVAQAALGYWELSLEGEDTKRPFIAISDWLVEKAVRGPAGLGWPVDFGYAKYGLRPGWTSAMGQGEAISVLLRAHQLTRERRYLDTAFAALGPLTTEVSRGGAMRRFGGGIVLEEYPGDRPVAVLNGWIFALLGVHELATTTGDVVARRLFEDSSSTLIDLLPRYDVGWWSRYSLYDHGRPDLAKPFYQALHPVLLDALNMVHPSEQLVTIARRWESQLTMPARLRISCNKIVFRGHRALRERSALRRYGSSATTHT